MVATVSVVTWAYLARMEPRLLLLEKEIRDTRDDQPEPFCANAHWYGRFKPRLSALVGWEADTARDPALTTSRAYEVAYRSLYRLLPDCRHEGMCWSMDDEGCLR